MPAVIRVIVALIGVCGVSLVSPLPLSTIDEPRGSLILIGGSERDDNRLLWDAFVQAAGGRGASIVVFPTASNNPDRTGRLYVEFFERLGLKAAAIPLTTRLGETERQRMVGDPQWIEQVRAADAVFLAGGEQRRYRQVLVGPQDQPTPMLEAIWHVYRKGGVVAGTSAGMAVMSHLMYVDAEFNLPVLLHGAHMHREVDAGLGFVPKGWLVDQHFLTRGRFARTLVALRQYDVPFGLGIDEDTAVVIEAGRRARVIGYRGVCILDTSAATTDAHEPRFNVRNVRLKYLSHGDSIDLATRQVTVGPGKTEEFKVDPYAPNFQPYYLAKQFYNDMVANTMLLEVMYKLVDSPHDEAIGLVFDGAAARKQTATPGFEFTFHRTRETVSWESVIAPGDSHTVLNVFLDVRPITIRGPLYE